MKKLLTLIITLFVLLTFNVNALDEEIEIGNISLSKSTYTIGETLSFDIDIIGELTYYQSQICNNIKCVNATMIKTSNNTYKVEYLFLNDTINGSYSIKVYTINNNSQSYSRTFDNIFTIENGNNGNNTFSINNIILDNTSVNVDDVVNVSAEVTSDILIKNVELDFVSTDKNYTFNMLHNSSNTYNYNFNITNKIKNGTYDIYIYL